MDFPLDIVPTRKYAIKYTYIKYAHTHTQYFEETKGYTNVEKTPSKPKQHKKDTIWLSKLYKNKSTLEWKQSSSKELSKHQWAKRIYKTHMVEDLSHSWRQNTKYGKT